VSAGTVVDKGHAACRWKIAPVGLTKRGVSPNIRVMHEQNLAILKGLIPVAWADGKYEDTEKQVIQALLEAFGATEEEAAALKQYASTPRGVDDIPLTDLSYDDRRVLLQHAVFLSYVDGDPSEPERKLIVEMARKLRIPEDEAKALTDAAAERAKRYLNML